MSQEGTPKYSTPTPDELDRARGAHQEADPTTFSALSPTEPLTTTGERTREHRLRILSDGENTYVPLRNSSGARQQLISRLLKGTLNVADVVATHENGNTQYLSKMLPHDRIKKEVSGDDVEGEVELLYLIFGDIDHRYYPSEEDTGEHKNLRIENNAVSYFDFEDANLSKLPLGFRSRAHTIASLQTLGERLTDLQKRIDGEEGKKFLASLVKNSGQTLSQLFPYDFLDDVETFQEVLLKRISHAQFLVRQEIKELEEKQDQRQAA